jgi:hypothetical protein
MMFGHVWCQTSRRPARMTQMAIDNTGDLRIWFFAALFFCLRPRLGRVVEK